MKELALKYGCNPNQKPSRIYMEDGSELPIQVLSGKPGYGLEKLLPAGLCLCESQRRRPYVFLRRFHRPFRYLR